MVEPLNVLHVQVQGQKAVSAIQESGTLRGPPGEQQ